MYKVYLKTLNRRAANPYFKESYFLGRFDLWPRILSSYCLNKKRSKLFSLRFK